MQNFLVVGDPHIRPEDVEEGRSLIEAVAQVAKETKPDLVVFTGDLFDSFEWVHVKVMKFWTDAMYRLRDHRVRILLGNHDGPHDPEPQTHALLSLQHGWVEVVDRLMGPGTLGAGSTPGIGWIPFGRSNQQFELDTSFIAGMGAVTAYCHAEFNGAKYDNGFYSKDGVDLDKTDKRITQFISGHIHTGQEFGRAWYVGAPRWRTASDANQDRYLWSIKHDDTGKVVGRTKFSTDPACQRLVKLIDTPAAPVDPTVQDPAWRLLVDIKGPAEWVTERKALWAGRARVRTFTSSSKSVAVRESDGIDVALTKYLKAFQPRHGATPEQLLSLARQRLGLNLE